MGELCFIFVINNYPWESELEPICPCYNVISEKMNEIYFIFFHFLKKMTYCFVVCKSLFSTSDVVHFPIKKLAHLMGPFGSI